MPDPKATKIVQKLLEETGDVDEAISRHLHESSERIRSMVNRKLLASLKEMTGPLYQLRYKVSFVLFDYDSRILFANATACSMFALPEEKVIGESIMRFYDPEYYGSPEQFSEGVEFFFAQGYWFGNARILSAKGEGNDLAVFTFLLGGVEGTPCVASLGMATENFKDLVDADHTADKKRYLEMSALIRGWGKDET
jgi:PAS domain-containing protein